MRPAGEKSGQHRTEINKVHKPERRVQSEQNRKSFHTLLFIFLQIRDIPDHAANENLDACKNKKRNYIRVPEISCADQHECAPRNSDGEIFEKENILHPELVFVLSEAGRINYSQRSHQSKRDEPERRNGEERDRESEQEQLNNKNDMPPLLEEFTQVEFKARLIDITIDRVDQNNAAEIAPQQNDQLQRVPFIAKKVTANQQRTRRNEEKREVLKMSEGFGILLHLNQS